MKRKCLLFAVSMILMYFAVSRDASAVTCDPTTFCEECLLSGGYFCNERICQCYKLN